MCLELPAYGPGRAPYSGRHSSTRYPGSSLTSSGRPGVSISIAVALSSSVTGTTVLPLSVRTPTSSRSR